ncbi:substrate-binding domain-containing protein [Pedobacter duraquae]|uniref:Phosphate ABC transporter substrate-binding protein (PhoT family) n=1 Tax=Pedobacter duraquae TaxID=425511 RepID=A0A4V3C2X7_9SPHI|nr:substrate-binding domain-containing protein [Pedobacter duraquae]TDO20079.1 phosphate ABC transporter substrate-binding protein (PhoT family) [Pedobacter duraquae]
MKKYSFLLVLLVLFAACKRKNTATTEVEESRTTGSVKILVDESFDDIVSDQIEVFQSDYPATKFDIVTGNENKILPTFLNDSVRVIIMSRVLTKKEEQNYVRRSIPIYTQRFAIDGIALVTGADEPDSTITADEVIAILKGTSTSGKSLVFDNPYSATVGYFKALAQISELPKKGVYTLQTNSDVIKFVATNKNYIGVVGVNWTLEGNKNTAAYLPKIKLLGVKNVKGKKGDDAFYKPTQQNLISGIYPFLRNVYIINCEGKEGLGTGFANWLASPRGQLIVLKSGLGPHKLLPREFNLKNTN